MKIVLINPPPYRHVEEYDLPTWQHLGLGRISSYNKQFGHTIQIIDAKLQRMSLEDVIATVRSEMPDVVGLTAMTPDIYNAYSIAAKMKLIDDSIVTVLGGCHATVLPKETMQEEPALDFLVFGEGERAFHELLDAISSGSKAESLAEINGLAFRDGGEIKLTATRGWDDQLVELPIPDWQLSEQASHYKLETSRGCPFQCTHCMRVLGEQVRDFPVEAIINEVKHVLAQKDCVSMEIVDETFPYAFPLQP